MEQESGLYCKGRSPISHTYSSVYRIWFFSQMAKEAPKLLKVQGRSQVQTLTVDPNSQIE